MDQIFVSKGFVMLQRSILDWQWYGDVNVTRVFIHSLIKANYVAKNWREYKVEEGQFITSIGKMAIETGLSVQTVRTALTKLEKTGYLKRRPTSQFTSITILESELFTRNITMPNKPTIIPIPNKKQSDNNPITTTKKEKNLKERKEIFKTQVMENTKNYNLSLLDSFYNNWSQENDKGKMKFEEENFWSLDSRLSNWKVFPARDQKRGSINNR